MPKRALLEWLNAADFAALNGAEGDMEKWLNDGDMQDATQPDPPEDPGDSQADAPDAEAADDKSGE